MRRSTVLKLVVVMVAVVLGVAVAEVALRLLGYGPRPWGATAAGYFWIADQELGFCNRAGGSYRNRSIVGGPLVTTDSQGFRNGLGWPAEGAQPTVVMVGDSTTFCAEVEDERTVASELARLLGERVQVLNAGVSGYSTVQARHMLKRCLDAYPSIRVAVHVHCGNDLVENLNPIVYHPAWAPTVRWDETAGGFVDVSPGLPGGAAGRPIAPPEVGRLHLVVHRLGQRSAVARLVEAVARRGFGLASVYGQPVVLDTGAIGPLAAGTESWREQVLWALHHQGVAALQAELEQMAAVCRERGVMLVAAEFTSGGDGGPGTVDLARLSRAAGARFVDLAPAFSGPARNYCGRRVTGDIDPHYGPTGTRACAAGLAPTIASLLDGVEPGAS